MEWGGGEIPHPYIRGNMPTPEIRDTKATPDSTISPVVPEPDTKISPVKPIEPAPEVIPTKPPVEHARQIAICNRMGEIIAENGGLVSNIPAIKTHEYWALKAELDALRTTP